MMKRLFLVFGAAIAAAVLLAPGNMELAINLGGEDILQGVGVLVIVVGIVALGLWRMGDGHNG